jgi:hypothetical protein
MGGVSSAGTTLVVRGRDSAAVDFAADALAALALFFGAEPE